MSTIIKVENLSKAYQLGQFTTGTLSRDIERWWKLLRGKEDPFLKIGEINNRVIKGESDIIWSLKNINFEIEQGDAVGIIGHNGAGKSTLFKLLSQITSPSTGSIKVKGRIASLLEVGTGFHPELSGRENIYLNGAILGMRKREIERKFDEIVDFAGVERYIDTPVKRYSSGMYVRLAFAVAAHLECEILIVDEVLAVGDAEFQKKCLGKMRSISKGEGRTVLFVSHNMSAVSALCNSGILLKHGRIHMHSNQIEEVIQEYSFLNTNSAGVYKKWENEHRPGDEVAKINSIRLINRSYETLFQPILGDQFGIEIEYELFKNNIRAAPLIVVSDHTGYNGNDLFQTILPSNLISNKLGLNRYVCWFPDDIFNNRKYFVKVDLTSFGSTNICHASVVNEITFEILENDLTNRLIDYKEQYFHGALRPNLIWESKNN